MKKLLILVVTLTSFSSYAGRFSEGLKRYENGETILTIGQIAALMDAAKSSNFNNLDLDPIFTQEEQSAILNKEAKEWQDIRAEARKAGGLDQ